MNPRLFKSTLLLALVAGLALQPLPALADTGPIQRIGNGAMTSLAASPDGRTLAVGTTIGIYFLDADTLEPLDFWDVGGWVTYLQYSTDGQYLRVNGPPPDNRYEIRDGNNMVIMPGIAAFSETVFDVATRLPASLDAFQLSWVNHQCAFGGDRCAIVFQGTVVVRNVRTGEDVALLRQWYTLDVAWSPDGTRFYTTAQGVLTSWDAADGHEIQEVSGYFAFASMHFWYADWVRRPLPITRTFVWVEEGERFAHSCLAGTPSCPFSALGSSFWGNSVRIIDQVSGSILRDFYPHHLRLDASALSSDGRLLVSSGYGTYICDTVYFRNRTCGQSNASTRIWDVETLGWLGELPVQFIDVAFSPDGTVVVGHTGTTLEAWEWRDGVQLWAIPENATWGALTAPFFPERDVWSFIGSIPPTHGISVSPVGNFVATYSKHFGATIRLRSLATGDLVETLTGPTDSIMMMGFTPDGSKLAAASRDHTVRVWAVP